MNSVFGTAPLSAGRYTIEGWREGRRAAEDGGRVDRESMRASHADREAVAQRLRVAFDEGRLTVDEFDERVTAAYAAVTYGELGVLTRDLPVPERVVESVVPAAPPAPRRRDVLGPWRGWLAGNVFFVAIWAWVSIAADHPVTFFPAFFMLFSAAGVVFHLVKRGPNG